MSIIPNLNNKTLQLLPDIALWKQQIANAINERGGNANPNSAFTQLAQNIEDIPNFPTTGFEYISEIYQPRTLMDAYDNRVFLKSIVNNSIEEIIGSQTFGYCTFLESVQFSNLVKIIGNQTFFNCTSLRSVQFSNLVEIIGYSIFTKCTSLESIKLPNLVAINGNEVFTSCSSLQSVECPKLTIYPSNFFRNTNPINIILGVLVSVSLTHYTKLTKAINITIGKDTNINLPFNFWTATDVINEGQSGIDELNSNLYNNLLTKLYDHSNDGETRILQIGWLDYITPENIAYANAKGWTLTT